MNIQYQEIETLRSAYKTNDFKMIEEWVDSKVIKGQTLADKVHFISINLLSDNMFWKEQQKADWLELAYLLLKRPAFSSVESKESYLKMHQLAMVGLNYGKKINSSHIFNLIHANHLHYKSLAWQPLFKMINSNPSILIENQWVSLDHMKIHQKDKKLIWQDAQSGQIYFKTTLSYRFLQTHTFHPNQGIVSRKDMAPAYSYQSVIKDTPSIIVGSILGKNETYGLTSNAHSFVGLLYADGRIQTYGLHEKRDGSCALLGKLSLSVSSPDWMAALPKLERSFKVTHIPVGSKKFKKAQDLLVALSIEGYDGSLLKKNCTYVVRQVLREAGLDIDSRVSLLTHLFNTAIMNLFGKECSVGFLSMVESAYQWLESVGLEKVIFFFPPMYILNLFVGLVVKMWSLGSGSDIAISFFDLFVRPWELSVNHPSILRLWQHKMEKEKKGFDLKLQNRSIPKAA